MLMSRRAGIVHRRAALAAGAGLVMIGGLGCLGRPARAADPVKVMTFNIKFDGDGLFNAARSWSYFFGADRRDRVTDVINAFGPDLLGVQEMLDNQRADLQGSLSGYGYYGPGRDGGSSGERSGIFYRTARFNQLDQGEFWLSDTPATPGTTFTGNGGDTGNPRMATWLKLQDIQTGSELFVINTHWSLDGEARRLSGELIRGRIDALSGGSPVIAMGDLNEVRAAAGYNALLGSGAGGQRRLVDSYDQSGQPQGRTFHNWAGGTDGSRIDHVLHSEGDFDVIGGSIIRTTIGGYYPSDHYPVTVTLEPVPEPGTLALLAGATATALGLGWRRWRRA